MDRVNRIEEWFRSVVYGGLRRLFRAIPMRESTRDRLRHYFLDRVGSIAPAAPRGRLDGQGERRAPVRQDGLALGFTPHRSEDLPAGVPATLVAFYLPQFHPIAENDAWWGEGFTEWMNVRRATAQFEGHVQPRLPGALGFYDLRDPQVMSEQAQLASEYGIGAFCFYFYWFGGKTLLEGPLERWLQDKSIDFPFCLCWANESWTRRWDGREEDVLIQQHHDPTDDIAFIDHVSRYLVDPRYLRVDGKPLLLVYRPGLMPDPKATARRWRSWCRQNGIGEICIAYVQSFERPDPRELEFDVAVEFPPNMANPVNITSRQHLLNPDFSGQVLDWRELAADYQQRAMPAYRLFPGVNCGWDNEPRRAGKGRTYLHSAPRRYSDWLRHTIAVRMAAVPSSDRLVFINAWNEWAEGAVLEPDARLGYAWLQATRSALMDCATVTSPSPALQRPCVVVHAWHIDAFQTILAALQSCGLEFRLVVTTSPEKLEQVSAALGARSMRAEIEVMENRGRDILPFLRIANRLLDEGEDVVLKLHTKQSVHRSDGDRWRDELLERLLSPARARRMFDAFRHDPMLGMIAPEGHVQPLSYYWGANQAAIDYLATRMGIAEPSTSTDSFVAGSMFWVRLRALRPLLDAHLAESEFEAEAGQLDGTFAHAVERIFSLSVRDQGMRMESAAAVCGEPDRTVPGRYPFAKRG